MSWLSSLSLFLNSLCDGFHAPAFLSLLGLTWRLRLNLRTFSFSALLSMAGTTENILWKKLNPLLVSLHDPKMQFSILQKTRFAVTKVDWVKYKSINKYLTCHHIVPLAARKNCSLQVSAPLSGSNQPVNSNTARTSHFWWRWMEARQLGFTLLVQCGAPSVMFVGL